MQSLSGVGQVATPSFLHDRSLRLIFFGGKGGVGKTTCATASAIEVARNRLTDSFLLVSTDPAHSVADCLADSSPPENLKIIEMNASQSLAEFKREHLGEINEIVSRGTFLDEEDINQLVDLSLPGMDEVMALLEINEWVAQRQYHCIFVDSAPSGHTLRLLETPHFINKWLRVLNVLSAKHHYMQKVFGKRNHLDSADAFVRELFLSLKQLDGVLRDPVCCRFVPVAIAERLSIRETVSFLRRLREKSIPIADVVINKIIPSDDCECCAARRAKQFSELKTIFQDHDLSQYSYWGIPMFPTEMRGEQYLCEFWPGAYQLSSHYRRSSKKKAVLEPRVEHSAALSTDGFRLIFFAGKGGVGKTTLACATALGAAQRDANKRILLLSIDPAHSLGDCLNTSLSSTPRNLLSNLAAMEIDAPAEFESLKGKYRQEIEKLFVKVGGGLDLTFDREVFERMMDLAPPGIDEIMAVTRISRLLSESDYDMVILDSAPTGHLIRLLELPAIVDQWLKAFFRVLLKHREVFSLGSITQKLVQLSKDIKAFRNLLGNHEECAMFVVSIPSEMAFLETVDLVTACRSAGAGVARLFLNMVTRRQDCFLCAALEKQEQQIMRQFREDFPDIKQTIVYTQREPIGLPLLSELAAALYSDAGQPERVRPRS